MSRILKILPVLWALYLVVTIWIFINRGSPLDAFMMGFALGMLIFALFSLSFSNIIEAQQRLIRKILNLKQQNVKNLKKINRRKNGK